MAVVARVPLAEGTYVVLGLHKQIFFTDSVMLLARFAVAFFCLGSVTATHIMIITLGGTRSHKVPLLALAKGLVSRGHRVTLVTAFPPTHAMPFDEVNPAGLVDWVKNFTNRDMLGPKLKGKESITALDAIEYAVEACKSFYSDPETKKLLSENVDLLVLGACAECTLGLVHHFGVPFVYVNTVAFYTNYISLAGSPTMYSVTPLVNTLHSDDMSFWERSKNAAGSFATKMLQVFINKFGVEPIIRKHLGCTVPSVDSIAKDVSLILQHGHFSLTYPRPYLPVVVEVACLHCRPPKPLPEDLETFVSGGAKKGFIFVSFGTAIRAKNMPEELRLLMVQVFSKLPYQVLWKYDSEGANMTDLPDNLELRWSVPQQDLLGHPKMLAIVCHGGFYSLLESVYHGVPMVTIPIHSDHAANSFKAVHDGFGIKLDFSNLTENSLFTAINDVIDDKRYKDSVLYHSALLKDQPEPPLDRALYWVEYILRHDGAPHMRSAARNLNLLQYFMLDTLLTLFVVMYVTVKVLRPLYTKICGSEKPKLHSM